MKSYQVMPPLSEEELEALKEDILKRGVMVPIELDDEGNILDGHHRKQICDDLGIEDYPTITRSGMTEEEKLTHARQLNMARRHLTQKQRRELIQDQIKERPEDSDRKIAEELGVSPTTVGTLRKKLEESGDVSKLDTSIDTLGRKQPRNRKSAKSSDHTGTGDSTGEGNCFNGQEEASAPEHAESGDMPDSPEFFEEKGPCTVEEAPFSVTQDISSCDDLRLAFNGIAASLDETLKSLLDDYDGNKEKAATLFSPEGISTVFDGLNELKDVVEHYGELVDARRQ